MSSLGMLGDYGSDSDITDSDDDFKPARSETAEPRAPLPETLQHEAKISTKDDVAESIGDKSCDPLAYVKDEDLSSSSSDDDSEKNSCKQEQLPPSIPLPLPDLGVSPTQTEPTYSSVFSNPFREAEEAKLAMLKRHVSEFAPNEKKPSPPPRFRGKHRRGGRGKTEVPKERQRSAVPGVDDSLDQSNSSVLFGDDDGGVVSEQRKRKQRSGVGETLVPPKKFVKTYKKSQAVERPWTVD